DGAAARGPHRLADGDGAVHRLGGDLLAALAERRVAAAAKLLPADDDPAVDRPRVDLGVERLGQLHVDAAVHRAKLDVAAGRLRYDEVDAAVHRLELELARRGLDVDAAVHGVRLDRGGGAGDGDAAVHGGRVEDRPLGQLHIELHVEVVLLGLPA